MSILKGLLQIATAPLRGVTEIYDDIKGKNSESEQGVSILTCGLSSVAKGTLKGLKDGLDSISE